MAAITDLIPPVAATRKVGNLMVLSPRTSALPKLLLKPGRWTVGSAATCSYRIVAPGVRPRHALLMCGVQTAVLKAWDADTYHNGQPVRGEVRLQPGDRVTVGTVEFTVESAGAFDVLSQLPEVPREVVKRSTSTVSSKKEPDGWDLERLRDQIQELREELSQRVNRRAAAIPTPPPLPCTAAKQDAERVAKLEQAAAEARQFAEQTQRQLAELRAAQEQREAEWQREHERLRAEATERERVWEQQITAWNVERDQWQQELAEIAIARQQLTAQWEKQQADLQTEALRWQTECEELRVDWEQSEAAWTAERSRLQEETQQQDSAIQDARQALAQREQELTDHSQQLVAEREQLEVERQQLQASRLESDQAMADLVAERQRVEKNAAEVLEKVEDLTRRTTEFEQQQSQLARDQQVLEHSWTWLQSDRRKLVEEKEQWQQQRAEWQAERERWDAEREQFQHDRDEFAKTRGIQQHEDAASQQLTTEREQFEAERAAWNQQREQWEAGWESSTTQLVAALAELQTQQQVVQEERDQLQRLRDDLDAHSVAAKLDRQTLDNDRLAFIDERSAWDEQRSAWNTESAETPSKQFTVDESSLEMLSDAWSIGVDLTAPRHAPAAEPEAENEPPTAAIGPTDSWTRPLAEATSLAQFCINPTNTESNGWDQPPRAGSLADFVKLSVAEVPEAPAWESSPAGLDSSPAPSPADSSTAAEGQDPEATALRQELAELFHLQGISTTPPETPRTEEATAEKSPAVAESQATPSNGPVVSILESMAFSEDEDVDDSVSRYMQHLLERSQQPGGIGRERYVPVQSLKSPTSSSEVAVTEVPTSTAGATPITVAEVEVPVEDTTPVVESPFSAKLRSLSIEPVHKQDKDAIRTATERMRQVANQQTLKNVQDSNWSRLKRSLKIKSSLAAFSFVLSAGLLFLGYTYRPAFLMLGICAAGLGVMTWVDLFIAIRENRRRTAQLAGRKKSD